MLSNNVIFRSTRDQTFISQMPGSSSLYRVGLTYWDPLSRDRERHPWP